MDLVKWIYNFIKAAQSTATLQIKYYWNNPRKDSSIFDLLTKVESIEFLEMNNPLHSEMRAKYTDKSGEKLTYVLSLRSISKIEIKKEII
jgi:hypothetical protein